MYRIKEILDQKGMTAKALADKMNATPQYISGIIRETGSASVTVLANIAKVLDVPVSSLFADYKNGRCGITHFDGATIVCPDCGREIKVKLSVEQEKS